MIDVVIPQPTQIVINNLVVNDISCFGFDDGSATVTASGGTVLSYEWSNNQTTTSATGFISVRISLLQMKMDVIFGILYNEPSDISRLFRSR